MEIKVEFSRFSSRSVGMLERDKKPVREHLWNTCWKYVHFRTSEPLNSIGSSIASRFCSLNDVDPNCELTHLMYLDGIELYAGTEDRLRSLLRIVDMFNRDIRMEFELHKCRIQAIHKGYNEPQTGHSIGDLHIQTLTETDFNKYLEGGTRTRVGDLKDGLLFEFLRCVKVVLKSHLSEKNKITALNEFAILSLAYAFEILP